MCLSEQVSRARDCTGCGEHNGPHDGAPYILELAVAVKDCFSAVANISEPYFAHANLDSLEISYMSNLSAYEKGGM